MKFLNKIYLLILLQLQIEKLFAIPNSPCPNIFTYNFDQQLWYGEIIFVLYPHPDNVTLSVTYSTSIGLSDNDMGNIELLNEMDVSDNYGKNIPLKLIYKFIFPIQEALPVIRSIMLNGLLYCAGVDDPKKRTIDTINYNLKIKLPSKIENSPVVEIPTQSVETIQLTNDKIRDNNIISKFSDVCGIIPLSVVQLIYKGSPAGLQPWLVSLYDSKNIFFCAGNLITNRHVITAAHCVQNQKSILLKIGAKTVYHNESSIYRTNKNIYINPEYKGRFSHGDIAIVTLNEPIVISEQIRPLCLWNSESDLKKVLGKVGTVVGWGLKENGEISGEQAKKVNVRIISQEDCLKQKITQSLVSDKTFCAQGIGAFQPSGPCKGDSGGALTMKLSSRWYIRGIISSTIGDNNYCDLDYYSVYADVAKYKDWILSKIND